MIKVKHTSAKINLNRHSFFSSMNFYIRNSLREINRRKLYYFLAVFSVLIVVTATSVSQTLIEYAPIILLKATESTEGSRDVVITPTYVSFWENDGINNNYIGKNLLLNWTRAEKITDKVYPGSGTARYTYSGFVNNGSYTNLKGPLNYSMVFYCQNTKRESEIGLGLGLDLPDEIPDGEIVISSRLQKAMSLAKGDQVFVSINTSEILMNLVVQYNFQVPRANRIDSNLFRIDPYETTFPVKINRFISDTTGKLPSSDFAQAIFYEYKYFFRLLADYMPPGTASIPNINRFKDFIRTQDPQEFAYEVIFNLPNRESVYSDSNFDNIQSSLTRFASLISESLGVFPYNMDLKIYDTLNTLRFAGLFLGLTLNIIIIVLFVLSLILVYNLLMVTIETKSFEMGVLRMVGLNKIGLVEMILIQALSFVLPAVIIGELIALPLLGVISGLLRNLLNANVSATPSEGAIIYSLTIGFLIPIISSYYPLKEALAHNLNLSLDLAHSKTQSVKVSIEEDKKKIPWAGISFGLLTVVFGICVYILIPLSLLSFNIGLLLAIFFAVLLGLLFGLVLISINFQHLMERFITWLFFFWTGPIFRNVIIKNLVAHKLRNRKTAIMYALSLGFVIMLSVSLNQQLENLSYSTLQRRGAYIRLSDDSNNMKKDLIENHIQRKLSKYVESYSSFTEDVNDILVPKGVQAVRVSHFGKLYELDARVRAIQPNYFKTAVKGFLIENDVDENTGLDLAEQLYTPRGSQGAIIGTFYQNNLGLKRNLDDPLLIQIQNGTSTRNEPLRVIGVVDEAPGFKFSSIPSVRDQDILVSFPTLLRLCSPYYKSVDELPTSGMIIKVFDDNELYMDIVYTSLVDLKTEAYNELEIFNYIDFKDSLESNQQAFGLIFVAVEIVVFILALFSLVTSMSSNILEQGKEVAVLRAIGVTKVSMISIYIGEAFVLVLSSALFGVLIGLVISWTMSLQTVLFTQIPIVFKFPTQDMIVILIAAIISAIVSTYLPAKRIVSQQIAQIIRSG